MRLLFLLAGLFLVETAFGAPFNNGEDPTRPLRRFDIRYKYQSDTTNDGSETELTFRTDQVFSLSKTWQLGLRLDLPFMWFYCSREARLCHQCTPLNHMADTLFQAYLLDQFTEKLAFAFGARWIFPTGGKSLEIGNGKYQFVPSIAVRYFINDQAFMGLIGRYAFSYAGYKEDPYVSLFYIQPLFNLNLPLGFFLNSSPEMLYNSRTHRWFIPLDLMVGYATPRWVISLEYGYGLVNQYIQYRNQIELRVGLFF